MSAPTWRALPAWPYPPAERKPDWFKKVEWGDAVQLLIDEIDRIGGEDLLIGIVVDPAALTWDGRLRSGWNLKVRHTGVEVSFDLPGAGRRVFKTDAFADVRSNVHAIARGLEALRKMDRYGIVTDSGEQYAGFAMLPEDTLVERGRALVAAAGGDVRAALKAHHPDTGGTDADAAAINAYVARQRP